jgi:hypothetical protein
MDMVSLHPGSLTKVPVPSPPVFAVLAHKLLADATGEIAKTVANASKATENFSMFLIFRTPCGTTAGSRVSVVFRQREQGDISV